jgi:hypothetical protein
MTRQPKTLAKWFFIFIAVSGVILLLDFLGNRSEAGNQFLFGFSRERFAVAAIFSLLLVLDFGAIFFTSFNAEKGGNGIEDHFVSWVENHLVLTFTSLCFIALTTGLALLILIPPVIRTFISFEQIGRQLWGFLLWLFLASSLLAVLARTSYRKFFEENRFVHLTDRFLLLTGIFLFVFFSYEHLLIWMGAANQSRYSYWNLLADEFLHGRLYLQHPPQTHDLTEFDGKWYVPMPPFPAILMMPLAYLIGGTNINTSDLSIVFSAINAVLVFLILEQLNERKWIRLSLLGMLLLIALFTFGNPHLWVGIRGRAWFVSQIVTVTFLALAVLGSLRSWSPWLVGMSIGFAVGSRPNAIMTWPFVFAIAMQIQKERNDSIGFKQLLAWTKKSAIPIGMAVGGLLLYNYARFQDFFDFGYVTISGDPNIVANAQTYGLFSLHYVPDNLKAMFINLPAIQPRGRWPILPSTVSTSMFLVTPPLIYLFHRYKWDWWVIGAWASVFLNFLLLVTYHNTGAHQFGYRYILDAILPILALLALSLKGRVTWHYVLLLLFSIAFNIYGAYWFING